METKNLKSYFNDFLDKRTSKKLVKRLNTIPKEQWLKIGHTLNKWEIPPQFSDLAPKWWVGIYGSDRLYNLINPVTNIISDEFGHKEQLRYHQINEMLRTEKEFEEWWDKWYVKREWQNITQ